MESQVQEYFRKPLPPFSRGDGDCVAWVAEYVNHLLGERVFEPQASSEREALLRLRKRSMKNRFEEVFDGSRLFVRVNHPMEGAICVFQSSEVFFGQGVGVFFRGWVITRGESDHLVKIQNPNILASWEASEIF